MAAPSTETTDATGTTPQVTPPVTYTAWQDLKSDVKSIANQAIWNAALLYPAYMYGIDRMAFNESDSDIVAAMKLAGIVAGVTEAQKLIRRTICQAGGSPKLVHPFGVPGS